MQIKLKMIIIELLHFFDYVAVILTFNIQYKVYFLYQFQLSC